MPDETRSGRWLIAEDGAERDGATSSASSSDSSSEEDDRVNEEVEAEHALADVFGFICLRYTAGFGQKGMGNDDNFLWTAACLSDA